VAYRRTAQIQLRLDNQRESILRAAVAQLADGGYATCTVAAVAARAGIATGTVYRHVSGKEELVAEAFRRVVGREVDAVRAAAAAPAPARARLAAVVETFAGRALRAPRLAHALLVEPVAPSVDELRLEFRRAFRDVVAGVVADGVAAGTLPPQPTDVVAAAIVGAIGEALVGPLVAHAPEPAGRDPAVVDALITIVDRAVGGCHAEHS
jgi:AcrR family transcriptional regulator